MTAWNQNRKWKIKVKDVVFLSFRAVIVLKPNFENGNNSKVRIFNNNHDKKSLSAWVLFSSTTCWDSFSIDIWMEKREKRIEMQLEVRCTCCMHSWMKSSLFSQRWTVGSWGNQGFWSRKWFEGKLKTRAERSRPHEEFVFVVSFQRDWKWLQAAVALKIRLNYWQCQSGAQ